MIYLLLLSIITSSQCDITQFSGNTIFHDEICYDFPWYKNSSNYPDLTIENIYYNFTLQNNVCNAFIVILPFFNWNLFCLNNCNDMIKPYSDFWGICIKSGKNSTLYYNIIANYTIGNPNPSPSPKNKFEPFLLVLGVGVVISGVSFTKDTIDGENERLIHTV